MSEILLGYEIGAGTPVKIPLRHTAVTGQTQESGKTTTLEAIITRSELRAVAFLTKRGEASFRLQTPIAPYFREPELAPETPMWRWVESIFETIGETVGKEEKAAIIEASDEILEIHSTWDKAKHQDRKRLAHTRRKVTTLEHVAHNVQLMQEAGARGKVQTALTCLNAYFKIVLPQIAAMKASRRLELAPGVNVMNLEHLTDEMQMLVIRSVIETVYRERKHTVVIVPEAAKFIPRMRNSPVRFAAEMFIRMGLGIGNVLMLDSQDLANVATEVLKSVGVWILGKQSEINEVRRVVDYIPSNPKIPRESIMQLGKGEFYVVAVGQVRKAYVQPAGMSEEHAQAIARGEESADSWRQIVRRLDRDAEKNESAVQEDNGGEEEMWKERFEALERAIAAAGFRVDESGRLSAVAATAGSVAAQSPIAQGAIPPANGDFEAFYAAMKSRLRSDSEMVALLFALPRIEVAIERPRIELDGSKMRGQVGRLIVEKFFAQPRPIADVRAEFVRRAWAGPKTSNMVIEAQVRGLAEMGFLTVEFAGYQQVAEAEIEIKEAK